VRVSSTVSKQQIEKFYDIKFRPKKRKHKNRARALEEVKFRMSQIVLVRICLSDIFAFIYEKSVQEYRGEYLREATEGEAQN
jgi:hypothetical protein